MLIPTVQISLHGRSLLFIHNTGVIDNIDIYYLDYYNICYNQAGHDQFTCWLMIDISSWFHES